MSLEDPGIASTISDPENASHVDKPHNPEWLAAKTHGRWAAFWNGRTYDVPNSEPRKKARRQKHAWAHLTTPGDPAFVPLNLCMTGDELGAEAKRIRGDGSSFEVPRTDEARELVARLPHGRLRRVEAMLLAFLAYAMLVRRRHGLVATRGELGARLGTRRVATAEAIARLVALGFVRADATYTRFGKCESQRGSLFRLTEQAIAAYALQDVPDGVVLPTGTVDHARLGRRRGGVGSRAGATDRNPDANQDSVRTPEKKPDSFRNGDRTASAGVEADCSEHAAVPAVAPRRLVAGTRQGESSGLARRLPEEPGSATDRVTDSSEFLALLHELERGGAS